jgi:hypothetical protein
VGCDTAAPGELGRRGARAFPRRAGCDREATTTGCGWLRQRVTKLRVTKLQKLRARFFQIFFWKNSDPPRHPINGARTPASPASFLGGFGCSRRICCIPSQNLAFGGCFEGPGWMQFAAPGCRNFVRHHSYRSKVLLGGSQPSGYPHEDCSAALPRPERAPRGRKPAPPTRENHNIANLDRFSGLTLCFWLTNLSGQNPNLTITSTAQNRNPFDIPRFFLGLRLHRKTIIWL